MRSLVVLLTTIVLIGTPPTAFAQTATDSFGSFLLQVSALAGVTGPVFLNGEPSNIVQPHPQTVLGLNDTEWRVLQGIADEYRARSDVFERQVRALTFDYRMALAAGENAPDLRRQIDAIQRQRATVLEASVNRLQQEMGPRFTTVSGFVEAHKGAESFFPTIKGVAK